VIDVIASQGIRGEATLVLNNNFDEGKIKKLKNP